MRAVRIRQVAGHVNLARFHVPQQLGDDRHVLVADRPLGDFARAVEGEFEEMELFILHADGRCRRRGFGLADQRLDVQHLFGVEIARLLGRDALDAAVRRCLAGSVSSAKILWNSLT